MDEAGRGCWAGPLIVAAVSLSTINPDLLADSKTLSRPMREAALEWIAENAEFVYLGWAEPGEIDSFGLEAATYLAYRRAARRIKCGRTIIIDGKINYLPEMNSRCIVKADISVQQVSAASIAAKVLRDRYMRRLNALYPGYNFGENVGYGTKKHLEGLAENGVCGIHRQSYKPLQKVIHGAS